MKHKSLVNALNKNGFQVNQYENIFYSKSKTHVLDWYDQNGNVICLCFRRNGDESCSITDYHSGIYLNTIKLAIKYLKGK